MCSSDLRGGRERQREIQKDRERQRGEGGRDRERYRQTERERDREGREGKTERDTDRERQRLGEKETERIFIQARISTSSIVIIPSLHTHSLTSWMAVMTTCCTDSSRVMMTWMYSERSHTHTH